MSNKDVLFNSSISLQNELLKIISNEDEPIQPKHEEPTDIFSEILEQQTSDKPPERTTRQPDVEALRPKRESDDDRVLTAQEIIYRALLNGDETLYEEYVDKNMAGGNSAENMIQNILTGGNKDQPLENSPPESKNDLFDEIHEGKQPEASFAGGNKPTTFAEHKHVTFAEKLNHYKSIRAMMDELSSESSEGSSANNSDDEDIHLSEGIVAIENSTEEVSSSAKTTEEINKSEPVINTGPFEPPVVGNETSGFQTITDDSNINTDGSLPPEEYRIIHPDDVAANNSNDTKPDSKRSSIPSGFTPVSKNNISSMSKASKREESSSSSDAEALSDSSSSEDEFIFPNDPHPVVTSTDKQHNAKYIRIINQFKNPMPKDKYHIIGGSSIRPKTVTVINAFPYIIKATPDNA